MPTARTKGRATPIPILITGATGARAQAQARGRAVRPSASRRSGLGPQRHLTYAEPTLTGKFVSACDTPSTLAPHGRHSALDGLAIKQGAPLVRRFLRAACAGAPCHRNAIGVTSRHAAAVSPFLARLLLQVWPHRHRDRCDRGQAAALRIVRPSPALRAGDHRPRAASTQRMQGKPASGRGGSINDG